MQLLLLLMSLVMEALALRGLRVSAGITTVKSIPMMEARSSAEVVSFLVVVIEHLHKCFTSVCQVRG